MRISPKIKQICRASLCTGVALLSLSGCWVPQVVEGVRPEIFDPEPVPPAEVARQSRTSKEVALATRMVEISQTTARLLQMHGQIGRQRQAVANHLTFSPSAVGATQTRDFPWQYQNKDYVYYDAQNGRSYTLSLLNAAGEKPGFDALGLASYGDEPLPSRSFPPVKQYQLRLSETRYGKSVAFRTTGTWPEQVPAQGTFMTRVEGTGVEPDVDLGFENLTFSLSGESNVNTEFTGELSFKADIDGQTYDGFGRLDRNGFVESVDIFQNGRTQLTIRRQPDTSSALSPFNWQVQKEGRVLASIS